MCETICRISDSLWNSTMHGVPVEKLELQKPPGSSLERLTIDWWLLSSLAGNLPIWQICTFDTGLAHYYTVHNIQCTIYSAQYTVHNIQCTSNSATLWNVHCICKYTVHNMQQICTFGRVFGVWHNQHTVSKILQILAELLTSAKLPQLTNMTPHNSHWHKQICPIRNTSFPSLQSECPRFMNWGKPICLTYFDKV